ncbi:MAG: hypothetical protein WA542_19215 [Candidatus Acidiferrum sp.]
MFGKSNRAIAGQFRLTRGSVQRHKKHVAEALALASEKRETSIGESILDRLEDLYQRGIRALNLAERAKNHQATIGYLRELRSTLAGLYEIGKATAPIPSVRPMPGVFVRAINEALGVGRFIPLGSNTALLPAGNGHSNGNGDSVIDVDEGELPVLPQD